MSFIVTVLFKPKFCRTYFSKKKERKRRQELNTAKILCILVHKLVFITSCSKSGNILLSEDNWGMGQIVYKTI
jgi:hypothetical protein